MRWDFKENKQIGDKIQDRTCVWLGQMSWERQYSGQWVPGVGIGMRKETPGDLSSVAHFPLS